jgi:hypothetical protein
MNRGYLRRRRTRRQVRRNVIRNAVRRSFLKRASARRQVKRAVQRAARFRQARALRTLRLASLLRPAGLIRNILNANRLADWE